MLLNEFLKQHHRVAAVASRLAQLKAHVNEQNAQIEKMNEQFDMSEFSAGPIRSGGPAPQVVNP
jgi:cell division protein FtsB